MEDYKLALSSFWYGVKSTIACTTPKVDATLYYQLVGILLCLTHTHPVISFVVGIIAQHMQTPHESHWKARKIKLLYV
jgi:hypothetical protein